MVMKISRSASDSTASKSIEFPGIAALSRSRWSTAMLSIPFTIPTTESCPILKVSYNVMVTIENLHVMLPVTN